MAEVLPTPGAGTWHEIDPFTGDWEEQPGAGTWHAIHPIDLANDCVEPAMVAILATSPSAFWPMQEVGGSLGDWSGNGHTATPAARPGTPTYRADGPCRCMYALDFRSSSWPAGFDVADHDVFSGPSMSMSVWVLRVADQRALGGEGAFIARKSRGTTASEWSFICSGGDSDIYANTWGTRIANTLDTGYNDVLAAPLSEPCEWVHLLTTYDHTVGSRGEGKVYENGVLIATTTAGSLSRAPNSPGPLGIGHLPYFADSFIGHFLGRMTMLAYWDRVLSAPEVTSIYESVPGGCGVQCLGRGQTSVGQLKAGRTSVSRPPCANGSRSLDHLPALQSFVVPEHVPGTMVMTAVGAGGGGTTGFFSHKLGGLGGGAEVALNYPAGTVITLAIGECGESAQLELNGVAGLGGWGHSARGGDAADNCGAGGGGGTEVWVGGTRIMYAPGGGGAGSTETPTGTDPGGGDGGVGGAPNGENGRVSGGASGNAGGGGYGATTGAVGAGGEGAGVNAMDGDPGSGNRGGDGGEGRWELNRYGLNPHLTQGFTAGPTIVFSGGTLGGGDSAVTICALTLLADGFNPTASISGWTLSNRQSTAGTGMPGSAGMADPRVTFEVWTRGPGSPSNPTGTTTASSWAGSARSYGDIDGIIGFDYDLVLPGGTEYDLSVATGEYYAARTFITHSNSNPNQSGSLLASYPPGETVEFGASGFAATGYARMWTMLLFHATPGIRGGGGGGGAGYYGGGGGGGGVFNAGGGGGGGSLYVDGSLTVLGPATSAQYGDGEVVFTWDCVPEE